jgi:hypothetical protein
MNHSFYFFTIFLDTSVILKLPRFINNFLTFLFLLSILTI